jgi:NAD+ synthase
LKWLTNKFSNVDEVIINLDEVFNSFEKTLGQFNNELAFANARARLRMTTLYQVAGANNGIDRCNYNLFHFIVLIPPSSHISTIII